jgi:hypothetical protein
VGQRIGGNEQHNGGLVSSQTSGPVQALLSLHVWGVFPAEQESSVQTLSLVQWAGTAPSASMQQSVVQSFESSQFSGKQSLAQTPPGMKTEGSEHSPSDTLSVQEGSHRSQQAP